MLTIISLITATSFAQKPKVAVVATPSVPAKVVPMVPTKELKKQLAKYILKWIKQLLQI